LGGGADCAPCGGSALAFRGLYDAAEEGYFEKVQEAECEFAFDGGVLAVEDGSGGLFAFGLGVAFQPAANLAGGDVG